MKHGTVEIVNDFDHGVHGLNQGSKTAQKGPESSGHLPRNKQRSNGQISHKPAGSEYYKGSDANLHPANNGHGSTLHQVPTPYFKLQTPAKLLSKSNVTFNS